MLNINLLPWRAQAAQYQLHVVKRMLLATCIILTVFSFLLHHYLNNYLRYSQQKIMYYQQQLRQKAHYPQQDVHAVQNLIPNIKMILLSLYSPQQPIYFSELVRKNKKILLKGTTTAPTLLTYNIMHLKLTRFFPEILIREIKPLANNQTYFVLETKYAENV